MQSTTLIRYSSLGLFLVGLLAAAAWSQAPSPTELRARSTKAHERRQFQGSLRRLSQALPRSARPMRGQVGQDLDQAVQCLHQPRPDRRNSMSWSKRRSPPTRTTGGSCKRRPQQYLNAQHQGFLIAGKYERGGHRGGGEVVNSVERDRVRALQLMQQAMPLAAEGRQQGRSLAVLAQSRRDRCSTTAASTKPGGCNT